MSRPLNIGKSKNNSFVQALRTFWSLFYYIVHGIKIVKWPPLRHFSMRKMSNCVGVCFEMSRMSRMYFFSAVILVLYLVLCF